MKRDIYLGGEKPKKRNKPRDMIIYFKQLIKEFFKRRKK